MAKRADQKPPNSTERPHIRSKITQIENPLKIFKFRE